jgi:hypothetical protein
MGKVILFYLLLLLEKNIKLSQTKKFHNSCEDISLHPYPTLLPNITSHLIPALPIMLLKLNFITFFLHSLICEKEEILLYLFIIIISHNLS